MAISHFHRTLAIGFHILLIVVVMGFMIGFAAAFSDKDGWIETMGFWTILLWLICIPVSIVMIVDIVRQPRAVWIEDKKLHFFRSAFDDMRLFSFFPEAVPLDSIAGVSSAKAGYPGVYVDLKSGQSHKVSTFLLRDSSDVVLARLREALTPVLAKA